MRLTGGKQARGTKCVSRMLEAFSFQRKCLKGMLVIYWPVRNFKQYSRLGQIDTPPISLGVKRRRWRWIGHVYRMPLASVPRVAMNRTRDIKRARGQTRRDTREITGLGDSRARGGKDPVRLGGY